MDMLLHSTTEWLIKQIRHAVDIFVKFFRPITKITVDKLCLFCYYYRAVGTQRCRSEGVDGSVGLDAGVAQPVEQLICNQQVGGSNPSTSSN